MLASTIDRFGFPGWVGVTALSFIVWWPLGLAALGYLHWRRRMGCGHRGRGNWEERRARWREAKAQWQAERFGSGHPGEVTGHRRSSGNTAFDEHRAETLKRLNEEEQEFRGFLDRLRRAKDKADFEQFLAQRGTQPEQTA